MVFQATIVLLNLVPGYEHIGRVTDGGGGAANVGKDYVGDENPHGIDGDCLAELNDHGGHQEDCGDIVQNGGNGGREEAQQGQQGPDTALGHLKGPKAKVVEDASFR